MALGAKGVISVLSNLYPEKIQHLTQTALAGDMTKAAQLQLELQPLLDLVFCDVNPIGIKAAMEICGYDCGGCRLPLTTLSPLQKQQLLQYFMLS